MRKKYLLFILLNSILTISAQVNIKPPNLDASSVFKFTETPVSLSNGLVNINLPVYTIKTKNLTIPIQLDYHSRGVKVEDIASSVGLGWSLSYGGMISRQVRDRPDDSTNGYLVTDTYNNFFTDIQKRVSVYNQLVFPPYRDLVPDQFYYSTPNYSGKFIFDQYDDAIVQQPFTDYKIHSTATSNSLLNGWTVIDDKGNKFYYGSFGNKSFKSSLQVQNYIQNNTPSFTYTIDSDNSADPYVDTWYLIQIETPTGEFVKYNYIPDESYYYKKDYDKIVYPCISYPCDQPNNVGVYTYFSRVNENKYLLESIEFPEGKIKFLQSLINREDIIGGKSLDKIQIFDNNNHLIEYFKFNYNITESVNNANVNPLLVSLDTSSKKRMFLSEAVRYSNNDAVIERVNYNYNTGNLPNRFSTSQDMWGYYNSASNGTYLHFFDYNGHFSSNRDSDEIKSKSGILESINFSTGLKTEFVYENNLLKPTFSMGEILGKVNSPYEQKSEILIKAGDIIPNYDIATNTYYKDITIDTNLYDSAIDITLNYHDFVNPNVPTICTNYTAWIEKNGERVILFPNRGSNKTILQGNSITRSLIAGNTYRLVIIPYGCIIDDAIPNPSESVSLILDYKVTKNNELLYYGPGNRIKEVKYWDDNILKVKKTYEYKDANGKNSGELFGMKDYVGVIGFKAVNLNVVPILDPRGVIAGSSNSSLESNNMGYKYAKEYYGDSISNKGRIDYEYTNFSDGSNFLKYPFTLSTDNQWARGLLVSKKYFENNNNVYNLLKEELNEYQFGGFDSPYAISPPMGFEFADGNIRNYEKNRNYFVTPLAKIYQDQTHFFDGALPHSNFLISDNSNVKIYYKPYYFNSGKIERSKSSVFEYRHNKTLEHDNTYLYNSNHHYQPTSLITTDSDNTIIETTYSYAHEKDNQYLTGKNMIGIPLETKVIKKKDILDVGKVLSKSEIVYPVSQTEADTKTSGLALPYQVKSTDHLGINSTEVTYDKYDLKGNLQQYTTKDGIPVAIIWGYNNTQPIAKIEGATYAQVSSLAAAIVTASDTDALAAPNNDEAGFLAQLDTFRKSPALLNYQIITYTYDPLIGVRSITPPSGIREVYFYDFANRLENIKDVNGKVLKEFKYNYKP